MYIARSIHIYVYIHVHIALSLCVYRTAKRRRWHESGGRGSRVVSVACQPSERKSEREQLARRWRYNGARGRAAERATKGDENFTSDGKTIVPTF